MVNTPVDSKIDDKVIHNTMWAVKYCHESHTERKVRANDRINNNRQRHYRREKSAMLTSAYLKGCLRFLGLRTGHSHSGVENPFIVVRIISMNDDALSRGEYTCKEWQRPDNIKREEAAAIS
jgi:hypothetical protein